MRNGAIRTPLQALNNWHHSCGTVNAWGVEHTDSWKRRSVSPQERGAAVGGGRSVATIWGHIKALGLDRALLEVSSPQESSTYKVELQKQLRAEGAEGISAGTRYVSRVACSKREMAAGGGCSLSPTLAVPEEGCLRLCWCRYNNNLLPSSGLTFLLFQFSRYT